MTSMDIGLTVATAPEQSTVSQSVPISYPTPSIKAAVCTVYRCTSNQVCVLDIFPKYLLTKRVLDKCMIQIEMAGPRYPRTIDLVPNEVRTMAERVQGVCVKGTAYYGGFLTSDMSVLKGWVAAEETKLDDSYRKCPLNQSIKRYRDFRTERDLRICPLSNIHGLPHRHHLKRRPRLAPTRKLRSAHILPTCGGRICGEFDGVLAESKGRVAAAWEAVLDTVRKDAAEGVAYTLVAHSAGKRRQRDKS